MVWEEDQILLSMVETEPEIGVIKESSVPVLYLVRWAGRKKTNMNGACRGVGNSSRSKSSVCAHGGIAIQQPLGTVNNNNKDGEATIMQQSSNTTMMTLATIMLIMVQQQDVARAWNFHRQQVREVDMYNYKV